jgi:ATP-dependent NAD(P)H-hydrate dehydratase
MYAANTVPLLRSAAASSRSKGECGNIGTIGGCEECVSRTFHTVIICNIICNMMVRYVGAPMFAAAAAMSCGADLSHIYCSSAASPPIKSQVYPLSHLAKTLTPLLQNCISQHASLRSCFNVTLCQAPDLIVHPSWSENKTPNPQPNATESPVISKWLPRHTALVIGSGLGRDPTSLAVASHALATGEACVTLNYPRCCACDPPTPLRAAVRMRLPVVVDADAISLVCDAPSIVR